MEKVQDKTSVKQRLLKGGIWVLVGFFINGVSGIALSALLSRILSPEELGAYFLSFSIVTIGSNIAQLGMARTGVRMVAASLAQNNYSHTLAVIQKILLIGFLSALVVCIILSSAIGKWLVLSIFKSTVVVSTIWLTSLWVAGHAIKGLVAEIFRGLHDIRMATLYNRLLSNVFFMLSFAVMLKLFSNANLSNVLTVTTTVVLIITTASLFHLYGKVKVFPTSGSCHTISILRVSLPLLLSGFMLIMMKEAHLWLLGAFQSEEEVAIYGAIIRIVIVVTMPLLLVNNMIPPSLAELYAKNDNKRLQKLLRISAVYAGVPSLLGVFLCVVFGADILSIAFGEYYRQGYFALAIAASGNLFNVFVGSPGLLLMMSGHERTMMIITLASLVISVFTSLFLIPSFGALGAACGFSAGRIASNLGNWIYVLRVLKVKTHFSVFTVIEATKILGVEIKHKLRSGSS